MPPRPTLRVLAAIPLIAAALLAGGCDDNRADGRARVVVSTTVLGDLVRNVTGDAADVRVLLRAGGDPHGYEPRPGDVLAVADADLVVASGFGLDGWMSKIAEQAGAPRPLEVGEHVAIVRSGGHAHVHRDGDDDGDHDHGDTDPHWWHDPRNAQAAVTAIRDALARANPSARAVYARNATAYLRRLRALDAAVQACVETVPPRQRKLVADHDAFGYFADRYGLRVVGTVLPSSSAHAQPSAGDLAALTRAIERAGVTAIFSQRQSNPKLARAVADETGVRSVESLYGDTLGAAGTRGATYLGMQAHNADAIVRGLTGGRHGCPRALAVAGLRGG